jgi:hypothetical protein
VFAKGLEVHGAAAPAIDEGGRARSRRPLLGVDPEDVSLSEAMEVEVHQAGKEELPIDVEDMLASFGCKVGGNPCDLPVPDPDILSLEAKVRRVKHLASLEEQGVVRFAGHIYSNLFEEVGMCDTTAAA